MKKLYHICCCLLLLASVLSCKSIKIGDAEKAEHNGEYHKAANYYNILYKRTRKDKREQRAYLAWHAAENYSRLGQTNKALSSYQSALRYRYPDSLLYLRIANSFHGLGRYKDAQKYYAQFALAHPQDPRRILGEEGCRIATSGQKTAIYSIRKSPLLNSPRGDFSATYAPDGSAIYFSSSRSKDPSISPSDITGLNPNNIYYTKRDNKGKYSKADSLPGGVNTDQDEGTPALSSDGKTLYYTYAEQNELYSRTAKIYSSKASGDGGWSSGTAVELWSDSLRMAAHPAPSPDGKWLYFVSEGGSSRGGKDLYRAAITQEGFGFPENLGTDINTIGDELFPYMATDSTLYFASNGHPGLGGLDIFCATLDSVGHWDVTHLAPPINSSADDFGFVFDPTERSSDDPIAESGLFSSTRNDALARPHLYEFYRPAIRLYIEGYVYDREGEPIPQAELRIVGDKGPVGKGLVYTKDDGSYRIAVEGASEYVMLAGASSFLNRYARIQTDTARQDEVYYVDFYLASRLTPEALKDIFYDFDKASLRPESKKSLDELIEILNDNPDISIRLTSHADRKGSDAYNLDLSDRRAKSVCDYLVSKGIDSTRLYPIGCGKQRPRSISKGLAKTYDFLPEGTILTDSLIQSLSSDRQQIADQLNRRTEFSVIPAAELVKMKQQTGAAKQQALQPTKEKNATEEKPDEGRTNNREIKEATTEHQKDNREFESGEEAAGKEKTERTLNETNKLPSSVPQDSTESAKCT